MLTKPPKSTDATANGMQSTSGVYAINSMHKNIHNPLTDIILFKNIEQSTYGRLEKDDNRLTAIKLFRIAKILNVSVSVLFGENATNIIHENKGDNAQAQIGSIVHQDKEHIESLKEEIKFLRKMLDGN